MEPTEVDSTNSEEQERFLDQYDNSLQGEVIEPELDYPVNVPYNPMTVTLEQINGREMAYRREIIRQAKGQLLRVCAISFHQSIPEHFNNCVEEQNDIEKIYEAILMALSAVTSENLDEIVQFLRS